MHINIIQLISFGDIVYISWDHIPKVKKHNKFCFVCSYCMGNLKVFELEFSHQGAVIKIQVCEKCKSYIESICKMPLCECSECLETRKKRPYYNKNHLKNIKIQEGKK